MFSVPLRLSCLASVAVLALTLTGCSFDQKPVIEKRAREFITAITSDNPAAAAALVDPVAVRGNSGAVQLKVGLAIGVVKLVKLSADDIRIDSIVVAEDGRSATVTVSHRDKPAKPNDYKTLPAYRWIKAEDGLWYITL